MDSNGDQRTRWLAKEVGRFAHEEEVGRIILAASAFGGMD
jgi:hypothetical protein